MARFNRSLRLRPVHTIKHVVDSQQGLVLGTNVSVNLIDTVDAPILANTAEVETGSTVNSVYLKVEAYATTAAALSNVYLIIVKNPGNNLSVITPNTVGSNDSKRYVIHQEMVMLEQSVNGNPRTLFAGVIRIPRGYKRFGIDDTLQAQLRSPGVNINFCLQCIYKEIR